MDQTGRKPQNSPLVNFVVFYWLDLVWHCTNKLRCVLKNYIFFVKQANEEN